MRKRHILRLGLCLAAAAALCLGAAGTQAARKKSGFKSFLAGLKREALRRGVSSRTLTRALARVRFLPDIIDEDRNQPEFELSFKEYLDDFVTAERIADGRKKLRQHRELLESIEARYGVQPRYIVALWGMETDYGRVKGDYPVLSALATLAYDERRGEMFRRELIAALKMYERPHIGPQQLRGSWAGAMGHCQFLPTRFLQYAVDFNGDGRRDIWKDLPDSFASTANFLNKNGWEPGLGLAAPAALPREFPRRLIGLQTRKTLAEWTALGVEAPDRYAGNGRAVVSLLRPAGPGGRAYLVFRKNFAVLIKWNAATPYVLGVGILAEKLRSEA